LNDKEGALRDYTIYLELKPNQFDALFRKALVNFELSRWAQANADFRQLLHLPTGETTSIYFRQGQFSEGTNQVFTSQGANKAHIFNYLGLTAMEMNEYSGALVHFDSALTYNPNAANYYVNTGRCYEALLEFVKAKSAYQTALVINPDHSVAQHNLSVLNRTHGQAGEAEQLLDEVINNNPDLPFPYAERAYYEMNNGELNKALVDYNKAIELSPDVSSYWLSRGMVREKLEDWNGAYRDYSQSIILNEKDEKAWLTRANLLFNQNDYKAAVKDYDVAIVLYSSYAIAYYNRALAKNKLGMNAKACADLKLAHALTFEVPSKVINSICGVQ
ncbi:MAG: tetratricopeptide repeat protein, partial [Cyclobacteriaceae bacterium]